MQRYILFLSIVSLLVPQSSGPQPTAKHESFRLVELRPYVYLEFDHIGPRIPRREDEPQQGIWLRLHNNCTEPIEVRTFGVPPKSDPEEIGLFDDVVMNAIDSSESIGSASSSLTETGPSIVTTPFGQLPAQPQSPHVPVPVVRDTTVGSKPNGYMFHVGSFMTIRPGGNIYFSLPVNHVAQSWHFEIPFRFALRRSGPYREPDSHLAFFLDDVPESVRSALSESVIPNPHAAETPHPGQAGRAQQKR
jgi:hypothetical protein